HYGRADGPPGLPQRHGGHSGARRGAGVRVRREIRAATPSSTTSTSPTTVPRSQLRRPDSLPDLRRPAGTESIPEIDHIVVVMQENHSFDNYFGMLGRGDGFTLDSAGRPLESNPYRGKFLRAYHQTDPCQP